MSQFYRAGVLVSALCFGDRHLAKIHGSHGKYAVCHNALLEHAIDAATGHRRFLATQLRAELPPDIAEDVGPRRGAKPWPSSSLFSRCTGKG